MKILGIDPSLVETGVVEYDNGKIMTHIIRTNKNDYTDSPLGELARLFYIVEGALPRTDGKYNLVVIEGVAMMAKNTRSLVQLSGLNYLLRMSVWTNCDCDFLIVPPTTLKKFITGSGKSDKEEMIMSVKRKYKFRTNNNNICDAYGLMQVGRAFLGDEKKIKKHQKEVLEKLKKQL